ncbi:type II secretion system F family protein [Nocardioides sp. HM23]|uniref:type II secretion system F family protein n=1 Tax=Nocardioides bizhenqiangii TaxID=3095076 RepID=UPI002ACA67A4|nr:type II secretion system F family protein [Nocardioides sp. HM23]MDZ5621564.1 type II secretion system F family protein [Nocardioides sp. HM23]
MTLTPTTLLIVLLGAMIGAGIVLLVRSLVGFPVDDRVAKGGGTLVEQIQAAGRRVPFAVGAFLLVLLLTRWLVVAIACALLVLFWDRLFGGAREARQGIVRLEGLAAWTESLRDTVAGAVGLEQAIPATAYAASPAIRADLTAMADRLRVRMPLPEALKRFAEDVDDAGADLIIAALILNSRLRGPGLRDVLTSLARSARLELEMRQRIYASRASTRRSVTIVVGITVAVVVGLAVFNRDYVEPYSSPAGQVVLVLILGVFAAGILWLRALAKDDLPGRFLHFRRSEAVR